MRDCTHSNEDRYSSRCLSTEQVARIYMEKIAAIKRPHGSLKDHLLDRNPLKGLSPVVAEKFRISAKTVRDIWNHRTWTNTTKKVSLAVAHDSDLLDVDDTDKWQVVQQQVIYTYIKIENPSIFIYQSYH